MRIGNGPLSAGCFGRNHDVEVVGLPRRRAEEAFADLAIGGRIIRKADGGRRPGPIQEIPAKSWEQAVKVSLKEGVTQLAPVAVGRDLTATPHDAYVTHKPTPGWQTPQGMGSPVYGPAYGRVPSQAKT